MFHIELHRKLTVPLAAVVYPHALFRLLPSSLPSHLLYSRHVFLAKMGHDNEGDTPVHQVVEVTQGNEAEKLGTEYDQRGMVRMGRKQELRRQFEMFSITGYAVILGCSWEFAIM